jgi:subtilisin-like proprotein convertase family protein
VVCDPQAALQYGCPDGTGCGDDVSLRYQPRYCSGTASACNGSLGAWGSWSVAEDCATTEVCSTTLETCVEDTLACSIGWGEQICHVSGASMTDCSLFGCGDPPPSITDSFDVGSVGAGEAVLLQIETPDRVMENIFDITSPFHDIVAELRHGGQTASFYNHYQGTEYGSLLVTYEFQADWYIPEFWGADMGGEWEIYFEDTEYSGDAFTLDQWCLTFVDPTTTSYASSGVWWSSDVGAITDADTDGYNSTYYEMAITPYIQFNSATQTPYLNLTVNHGSLSQLSIQLITADGTTYNVKNEGSTTITSPYYLTAQTSDWLTGRYRLRVRDHVEGVSGSVLTWGIQLQP